MTSRLNAAFRTVAGTVVMSLVGALPLLAQQSALPGDSGLGAESLRPYHFVFLAYALAWILVFGWVVSIGRRISKLSERLGD
jgi:CcmD family protein